MAMAKICKNGPFFARTSYNFYFLYFWLYQFEISCRTENVFFLIFHFQQVSTWYDLLQFNFYLRRAIVFEKFTARIFKKESAPVII